MKDSPSSKAEHSAEKAETKIEKTQAQAEKQQKHWAELEQQKIDDAVLDLNESGDLEKLGGELEEPKA